MDLFGYTTETVDSEDYYDSGVKIKVIGVGGGGGNAVNRMLDSNIRGVEFITVNCDRQALMKSRAKTKVIIGERITSGHGAGSKPDVGKQAAEENLDDLKQILNGAHMVFITTGMGGGTGTGAAPVVAKLAKDMGILTIGIVTKPFAFEGRKRMVQAELGIENLSQYVDSLIVIPNERLKQISENKITLSNAFAYADDVLRHGVQSISDLISSHGIVNLDFADVSSVMKEAGYAHMGVGEGKGKDKAEIAAKMAVTSPLLETAISGATGILINITASPDISLDEVETASALVSDEADPDATIIWGLAFDERLDDTIKVTVIATGFPDAGKKATTDTFRTAFAQSSDTTGVNRYSTENVNKFSTENMNRFSAAPSDTAENRVPSSNVTDIMHILNSKKRF